MFSALQGFLILFCGVLDSYKGMLCCGDSPHSAFTDLLAIKVGYVVAITSMLHLQPCQLFTEENISYCSILLARAEGLLQWFSGSEWLV